MVDRIIQESVNKNPISMKEALEDELYKRIALALEAKKEEMNFEEEDDEDENEIEDDEEDEIED